MSPPSSRLLPALILLTPLSLLAAMMLGSYELSLGQLWHGDATARGIFWQLRAPRAFSAFACGGLLAVSGLLLQLLLRNPLADPYLLGVSGGAASGVLAAMLLGLTISIKFAALAGALAAVGLVGFLGTRGVGWNTQHLLLTGIALSAGFSALISLMLSLAPLASVKGMLFWLMGDLSYASQPELTWLTLAVIVTPLLALGRHLDILALGEFKARSLGVATHPLQMGVFVAAAAATAMAVLEAGSIGFVGMIIPHALRLAGLHEHRRLIPASALLGGIFLVLADLLARTLFAPQQLPVGVVTALLGAPLLLLLLNRHAQH